MKVIIDGESRDWTFDQGGSLEDVVMSVNQRLLSEEGRVVVEIKLDDYEKDLDSDLTWDKVPFEKINQISLQTEPLDQNINTHLDIGLGYLEESRDSISRIVGDMLSGEINSAMEILKESIEKLLWFFNLLTQIENSGATEIEDLKIKQESFKDFVVRFNTTLKEIAESMSNNDTTLINDFLEYELEPAIGDLIDLVPVIRARVSEKSAGVEE